MTQRRPEPVCFQTTIPLLMRRVSAYAKLAEELDRIDEEERAYAKEYGLPYELYE